MFLGIDISKHNFDAALLETSAGTEAASKPRHRAFPNTPDGFERLAQWLGDRKVHACLEATNTYADALARFLHAGGHTVSVVNPAQVKAHATAQAARAKTDKADAALIARFCLMHRPAPWTPPLPEVAELQALVRRLEALHEMRQMEINRKDTAPDPVHASIEAVLAVLDQQITATQKAIKDHVDTHPTLRQQSDLLASIPGIGRATAATLLAEVGDFEQFACARKLAAFAGLDPRVRQSGTSVRGHSSLSKAGSPRLRKALYFPAMTALRFNPAIAALRQRLILAGKPGKLIVGAAMRKLLSIAFGVLRSGRPFDATVCLRDLCLRGPALVPSASSPVPAKKAQELALAA
jgi:transposase